MVNLWWIYGEYVCRTQKIHQPGSAIASDAPIQVYLPPINSKESTWKTNSYISSISKRICNNPTLRDLLELWRMNLNPFLKWYGTTFGKRLWKIIVAVKMTQKSDYIVLLNPFDFRGGAPETWRQWQWPPCLVTREITRSVRYHSTANPNLWHQWEISRIQQMEVR